MDEGAKVINGTDRLPTLPRFDQADKALVEKRYDDAIGRYLESAKEVPGDAEPLRRAGEACILAGRPDEGLGHLRRALELTSPPEDRASLGFRMAELLERKLGRPDDARELLVALAGEFKGTRFAEYAWGRHANLSGGLPSR
jgi:tetratricopeptide (TPR) repeat protein